MLFKKNEAKDSRWFGIIYSEAGVGKTTAAIKLGAAILDCEGSARQYECNRAEITNTKELYEALKEAYDTEDVQTIAIDGLDSVDNWLLSDVITEGKVEIGDKIKSLSDFPYGQGHQKLLDKHIKLCSTLEKIAQKKNVLILAHAKVKTVSDPTVSSEYDRLMLRLPDKPAQWWFSRVDFVLFARIEFVVANEKAVSKRKRSCYSTDMVSFMAKSRIKEIPECFSLDEIGNYLLKKKV